LNRIQRIIPRLYLKQKVSSDMNQLTLLKTQMEATKIPVGPDKIPWGTGISFGPPEPLKTSTKILTFGSTGDNNKPSGGQLLNPIFGIHLIMHY